MECLLPSLTLPLGSDLPMLCSHTPSPRLLGGRPSPFPTCSLAAKPFSANPRARATLAWATTTSCPYPGRHLSAQHRAHPFLRPPSPASTSAWFFKRPLGVGRLGGSVSSAANSWCRLGSCMIAGSWDGAPCPVRAGCGACWRFSFSPPLLLALLALSL